MAGAIVCLFSDGFLQLLLRRKLAAPKMVTRCPKSHLKSGHFLGGGFKYCSFLSLKLGKCSNFDEHIFQVGWNHQSFSDTWNAFCVLCFGATLPLKPSNAVALKIGRSLAFARISILRWFQNISPWSSKYLMSRCLDPETPPRKTFRGWKHPLGLFGPTRSRGNIHRSSPRPKT